MSIILGLLLLQLFFVFLVVFEVQYLELQLLNLPHVVRRQVFEGGDVRVQGHAVVEVLLPVGLRLQVLLDFLIDVRQVLGAVFFIILNRR
jgi:hypothetical protein